MYLQFISFLHIDMTQVVEILTHVRQKLNIKGADVLATQGAMASANMALIMLNWNYSVPACKGLIIINRSFHFIENIPDTNNLSCQV